MRDESGWYGLLVNGELVAVQWFKKDPLIWDFHLGFYSSQDEYEVVEVDVAIVGRRPQYA